MWGARVRDQGGRRGAVSRGLGVTCVRARMGPRSILEPPGVIALRHRHSACTFSLLEVLPSIMLICLVVSRKCLSFNFGCTKHWIGTLDRNIIKESGWDCSFCLDMTTRHIKKHHGSRISIFWDTNDWAVQGATLEWRCTRCQSALCREATYSTHLAVFLELAAYWLTARSFSVLSDISVYSRFYYLFPFLTPVFIPIFRNLSALFGLYPVNNCLFRGA